MHENSMIKIGWFEVDIDYLPDVIQVIVEDTRTGVYQEFNLDSLRKLNSCISFLQKNQTVNAHVLFNEYM